MPPTPQPAHLPPSQINFWTLLSANPAIANPDLIYDGQELNLPCPPQTKCKATVIVRERRDTVVTIAMDHNADLRDLLDANLHIVNPLMLFNGDIIFVPPCEHTPGLLAASAVKPARASCINQTYIANKGDKPGTVAAMFNMQIRDLFRLNPRLRVFATRFITAGQSLAVLSCPKAIRLAFTSAQVCKYNYTTKRGDTAKRAAAKANTTITKLVLGNPNMFGLRKLPAKRVLCIIP